MLKNKKTFLFLLFAVVLTSCDMQKRDPQAEFLALRDAVFSTPQEGRDKVQEYIDYFYEKDGARIDEARELRRGYRKMCDFFSQSFDSYEVFLKESRQINEDLSNSNFEGVRKLWQTLYEKERNRLLGPMMDQITNDSFDLYFKNQVKRLCDEELRSWEVTSIDQMSLTTPELDEKGDKKKARGVYRVHLKGGIIGVFDGTAQVAIEGEIGVNVLGELYQNRIGYEFQEKPLLH